MNIRKAEHFALIPESVLFHDTLSSTSKLLWGVIYSLTRKDGYCWASNAYLSKTLKKSKRTIIDSLKELKDSGFISVYVARDKETKVFISRQIVTNISLKGNDEIKDPRTEEGYDNFVKDEF